MKRRQYTSSFKAKVALDALKGDKTMAELSQKYSIHQNLIQNWKRRLVNSASDIFTGPEKKRLNQGKEIKDLHEKIGQLTMEKDFLLKVLDH